MSELEFSLIIVSIICGIVITKVLGSIGDMIQGRMERPIYWVHVGWMVFIVLSVISGFRSAFLTGGLTGFGYWHYTLALVPFACLVVLSHMLCPDLDRMTEPSTEAWYYAHAPDFFRGFALFIVINAILVNMLGGIAWLDPIRLLEVPAVVAVLLISRSSSRRVHAAAIGLFYVGLFASTLRYQ